MLFGFILFKNWVLVFLDLYIVTKKNGPSKKAWNGSYPSISVSPSSIHLFPSSTLSLSIHDLPLLLPRAPPPHHLLLVTNVGGCKGQF